MANILGHTAFQGAWDCNKSTGVTKYDRFWGPYALLTPNNPDNPVYDGLTHIGTVSFNFKLYLRENNSFIIWGKEAWEAFGVGAMTRYVKLLYSTGSFIIQYHKGLVNPDRVELFSTVNIPLGEWHDWTLICEPDNQIKLDGESDPFNLYPRMEVYKDGSLVEICQGTVNSWTGLSEAFIDLTPGAGFTNYVVGYFMQSINYSSRPNVVVDNFRLWQNNLGSIGSAQRAAQTAANVTAPSLDAILTGETSLPTGYSIPFWELSFDNYSIFANEKGIPYHASFQGNGTWAAHIVTTGGRSYFDAEKVRINYGITDASLNVQFVPGAPLLTYPAQGATGSEINPLFQWGSVVNADNYVLQVSSSSVFSSLYIEQYTGNTQYQLTTPLLNMNIQYYWRVGGIRAPVTGSFATGSFTTGTFLLFTISPNVSTRLYNFTNTIDFTISPSGSFSTAIT